MPGNPFWLVGEREVGCVRLVFVKVAETKQTKNQLHLDVLPEGGSQAQEVARLEALGATIVEDRRSVEPGGWVVMADPEGNEFCVEGGASRPDRR
ncbi:VOC family protein [Ferrimicrobium sp.]|uniref:VOC family protein n=1 Tax=Ferrimicrobium sp. TaxID=2926050 RepID=UPI00262AE440|nr:VOC family protein [Ferrimicrobium sp.]